MSKPFSERISDYLERIDGRLDEVLPGPETPPRRLHEAMRYSVFNGGKRIRPLLVYASGESLGVDVEQLDAPAVAIELLHAFSLVHDDLPAMDNDELRRGQPTVHRRFGEATAILAADALQPLAFRILADAPGTSQDGRIRLLRLITRACGSLGMTGGQSIDLQSEGRRLTEAELEQMYALKTGAMIEAAVMSASCLAPRLEAAVRDALAGFARNIGIAFQIKDDILDIQGETNVIGKRAGADERLAKATYPAIFGVDAARRRCDELLQTGMQRLNVFGEDADALRWLARFIVTREK